MVLGELFDAYSRQARLQPALIALVPLFLTVAIWYPKEYTTAVTLAGLAVSCGLAGLLAHLARHLGRRAERRLYEQWGGRPTTIWLRHRDQQLDQHTKARYHAFLEAKVPNWTAPTAQAEAANPSDTDVRYDAAVKWLLEYTRDTTKFPLLFKENISYGFRRNLYGLRLIGFIVAVASLVIEVNEQRHHFYSNSGEVNVLGGLLIGVCLAMILCWFFLITEDWVKDAANSYTRALLAACDAPPPV